MLLNKEDDGNRKYILCSNNKNCICEEVTYKRLKNIQSDLPHNLKYYKTDFVSKFDDDDETMHNKMMAHIEECRLFIRSGIFLSKNDKIILDSKRVIVVEIPEYYFREELKEAGEL